MPSTHSDVYGPGDLSPANYNQLLSPRTAYRRDRSGIERQAEELPCAGDPLELVGAERLERHRLARDRSDDRPGHDDLAGAAFRQHSARDVHGEARDIVPATVDVADMQADADVEPFEGEVAADLGGDAQADPRRGEQCEDAITSGLY